MTVLVTMMMMVVMMMMMMAQKPQSKSLESEIFSIGAWTLCEFVSSSEALA